MMRTTKFEIVLRRQLNQIIVASVVVWLGVVLVFQPELVSCLWLLAPQVWIPLIIKSDDQLDSARWSASAALCGSCVACSFCWEPGMLAGWFAVIWLLWVCGFAMAHLLRVSLLEAIPYSYLLIGAIWFTAARFNQPLLDYPLGITFLTGVHFHFGGFLLPQLAGWLERVSKRRVAGAAMVGVVGGFPLVALGMLWWPTMELVGVVIVLMSVIVFVIELMRFTWRHDDVISKLASLIAVGSALMAVGFGLNYGWGEFHTEVRVHIPTMIQWHGTANAIGVIGSAVLIQARSRRRIQQPSLT